jgi:hypothetical protein
MCPSGVASDLRASSRTHFVAQALPPRAPSEAALLARSVVSSSSLSSPVAICIALMALPITQRGASRLGLPAALLKTPSDAELISDYQIRSVRFWGRRNYFVS